MKRIESTRIRTRMKTLPPTVTYVAFLLLTALCGVLRAETYSFDFNRYTAVPSFEKGTPGCFGEFFPPSQQSTYCGFLWMNNSDYAIDGVSIINSPYCELCRTSWYGASSIIGFKWWVASARFKLKNGMNRQRKVEIGWSASSNTIPFPVQNVVWNATVYTLAPYEVRTVTIDAAPFRLIHIEGADEDYYGEVFAIDDMEVTPYEEPSVDVSVMKSTDPAHRFEARVVYDLKAAVPKRNVTVKLRAWTDAAGVNHAEKTLATIATTGDLTGTYTIGFDSTAPSRQVSVAAEATAAGFARSVAALECARCDAATADPVYLADGNARFSEVDSLPPVGGRQLVRTYDSDEQAIGWFGRGFSSLLDQRIINSDSVYTVVTSENDLVAFGSQDEMIPLPGITPPVYSPSTTRVQIWPRTAGETAVLTIPPAAYSYRAAATSEIVNYDSATGVVTGWRNDRKGFAAEIAYVSGSPASVTDLKTHITWLIDTNNRRVTSITVAGQPEIQWSYDYDASGNLLAVTGPTGLWRTYEYMDNRIIAVRDGAGNLIESHTYGTDGYATSSTGPSDEVACITYNLAGSSPEKRLTRIQMKSGAISEYRMRPIGGTLRVTDVRGNCATCGAGMGDRTYVRNTDGTILREQAPNGFVTARTYSGRRMMSEESPLRPNGCDPLQSADQCRLSSDALATATLEPVPTTARIDYAYDDPNWPERPTSITRSSILQVGGDVIEIITYDASTGAVLTRALTGWTGDVESPHQVTSRTVMELYDGTEAAVFAPGGPFDASWLSLPQPAGLNKRFDGARTDVMDTTEYVYYPDASAVPETWRGHLAAVRNALGHIVHYADYDAHGNADRIIDSNGVVTERVYDAGGRLITSTFKGVSGCDVVSDPLCDTDLTWSNTYDSDLLSVSSSPSGSVTSYSYDSRRRVTELSRGFSASDLREQIATSYDPLSGKKQLERYLSRDGTGWSEMRRESYGYDSAGRLEQQIHADGTSVGYSYAASGALSGVRDERHVAANSRYAYDESGRLRTVVQDLDAGIVTTSYDYDRAGNLIRVTDPNGNVTSYHYDDFGRMLQQASPVTGITTYEYDEAGDLIRSVDGNGLEMRRTYDALGRARSATTGTSADPFGVTETLIWTYDDTARDPFGIGHVATASSSPCAVTEGEEDQCLGTTVSTFTYDRRGFLLSEKTSFDGDEYTQMYRYDGAGNRINLTYPSGRSVDWTYDYAGRPLSAEGTFDGSATAYITEATYLPFGPLTSLQYGNGVTEQHTFNARYHPSTIVVAGNGQTHASLRYTTDASGNVSAIEDQLSAPFSRFFQYDDLGRLLGATTGTALWGTAAYTYDSMGNISTSQVGPVFQTFTYSGPTPKLATVLRSVTRNGTQSTSTSTVTYDEAGNEIAVESTNPEETKYTSNFARNLESSVTRLRHRCVRNTIDGCANWLWEPVPEFHTFDARGVLVGVDWQRFFYSPELQPLNVMVNGWSHDVIWFGNRPVAQEGPDRTVFTSVDHLGTPMLQTSTTGEITWRAEYEPYGNVFTLRNGTSSTEQPLRFPGQQVSHTTSDGQEENYNIFRWYRSGWGRYTQADPLAPGGLGHFERGRMSRFTTPFAAARDRFMRENATVSNPALIGMSSTGRPPSPPGLSDATNPYAYAADSPVMYTDPLGLAPCLTMTISPKSGYVPAGPPGKMFKGCQYIGECYGWLAVYEKEVELDCKCKDFCLISIDPATAIPNGPTICFNTPPWWAWSPPLIK